MKNNIIIPSKQIEGIILYTISLCLLEIKYIIMEITNINNSIVFEKEKESFIFPINSIYVINIGDVITVRLKGNRRNLFSFNYHDVSNITASSVEDFMTQINAILFK